MPFGELSWRCVDGLSSPLKGVKKFRNTTCLFITPFYRNQIWSKIKIYIMTKKIAGSSRFDNHARFEVQKISS